MEERINELLNHPKSNFRSETIDQAVKIEFLINQLLTRVFACDNNKSISFGTSSSSLSFMAKVNLLLDLKVLTTAEKKKLVTFAEIRNQVAHNFMVMTADLLSDDTKMQLRKLYKAEVTNVETYDEFNILLYNDVKNIIDELITTLIEKAGKKVDAIGNLQFNEILFKEVWSYCESDGDFKDKLMTLIEKATDIYKNTPLTDDEIDALPLL